MKPATVKEAFQLVPKLVPGMHKGSCGRVAVIGGSEWYAGAPYLAAMSSMRCGSDLLYVLVPPEVAVPVKCYSPDLIVKPLLADATRDKLYDALERCHAVAIGPGLGDVSKKLGEALVELIVRIASEEKLGLLLDADAIKLVAAHSKPVTLGRRAVLTPNRNEFKFILSKMKEGDDKKKKKKSSKEQEGAADDDDDDGDLSRASEDEQLLAVARRFQCTVLLKGEVDAIADQHTVSRQSEYKGSLRRIAGQGDVLSGAIAAFLAWQQQQPEEQQADAKLAAIGGSAIVRKAAEMAFQEVGPTFIASDLHKFLGPARTAILRELTVQSNI